MLQKSKKTAVWDPARPLLIAPVSDEGKALVAAGKIGLGPMIDVKTVALWPGEPMCSPKQSVFLPNTRPLVAISVGAVNDPGPPEQSFDWEEEAIASFRSGVSHQICITGKHLKEYFCEEKQSRYEQGQASCQLRVTMLMSQL